MGFHKIFPLSPSPPHFHLSKALLCKDLGNTNKGRIEYLQPLGEQSGSGGSPNNSVRVQSSLEGGYPEGSMANVTCDEGYRTNGSSITCHNGIWSGGVPQCTSEWLSL